jgi:hypothetical protein
MPVVDDVSQKNSKRFISAWARLAALGDAAKQANASLANAAAGRIKGLASNTMVIVSLLAAACPGCEKTCDDWVEDVESQCCSNDSCRLAFAKQKSEVSDVCTKVKDRCSAGSLECSGELRTSFCFASCECHQ